MHVQQQPGDYKLGIGGNRRHMLGRENMLHIDYKLFWGYITMKVGYRYIIRWPLIFFIDYAE